MAKPTLQAPKGTRDLYPLEMARRRWLMERWRRVSINHGFEEIDGPTFEASDLYAVKSGDGILGELFQSFSGKDPAEVESVKETGRAPYAMRPEFTPTLARMYAARAAQLPKPTKWFMAGPFFRAEKPQRGRLREFLQWNADVLGDETENADTDLIACLINFLVECGLTPSDCRLHLFHRDVWSVQLEFVGIQDELHGEVLAWIDRAGKVDPVVHMNQFLALGGTETQARSVYSLLQGVQPGVSEEARQQLRDDGHNDLANAAMQAADEVMARLGTARDQLDAIIGQAQAIGLYDWIVQDPSIVRGLAYYTGTVFEVIADGERAIAGGGRYDNLVELFGGPPTPAVGFGMGDVVLTNLLQDKDLMPSDKDLLDEIGARPDVFLITPEPDLDQEVTRTVAHLRKQGLHARRTTKTTRNVGKLLQDANKQHARFAIILEAPGTCTVKNLDEGDEHKGVPVDDIIDRCRPTA